MSAPSGEYARAIEDAAKVAEQCAVPVLIDDNYRFQNIIVSNHQLAAAIRALSPAPREDARLAVLLYVREKQNELHERDTRAHDDWYDLRQWLNAEIARLSPPRGEGA